MTIISWYTLIGLFAQCAFAARMLVQWFMSERAKRVVNPALFWWLSLIGSLSMSLYGFLRSDFAIMLAQLVSFYIYIYNLKLKKELFRFGKVIALLIIVVPLMLFCVQLKDFSSFFNSFLNGQNIPYGWMIFGLVGQSLFSIRFIYQMIVSHRKRQSVLPEAFWYISLMAAIMVQIYGIYRVDIVLIIGQIGGMITYVRNIMLILKNKSKVKDQDIS